MLRYYYPVPPRPGVIDASHEGDLLARAGVSWTAGRESNDAYSETLSGIQFHGTHQFRVPVDAGVAVQDVGCAAPRRRLLRDGAVL